MQLSRIEVEVVCALIAGQSERARGLAEKNGLLRGGKHGSLSLNREGMELETKLKLLGLAPPWTLD